MEETDSLSRKIAYDVCRLLAKIFTTKMVYRRRKVILIFPPTLPPPTIINTHSRAAGWEVLPSILLRFLLCR